MWPQVHFQTVKIQVSIYFHVLVFDKHTTLQLHVQGFFLRRNQVILKCHVDQMNLLSSLASMKEV